jgi:hypothetical protein
MAKITLDEFQTAVRAEFESSRDRLAGVITRALEANLDGTIIAAIIAIEAERVGK